MKSDGASRYAEKSLRCGLVLGTVWVLLACAPGWAAPPDWADGDLALVGGSLSIGWSPIDGSLIIPEHWDNPDLDRYPALATPEPAYLSAQADAAPKEVASPVSEKPGSAAPRAPTLPDSSKPATGTEEKPLGEAPPDNSQLFLRTATVLLQPGHTDVDFGIQYSTLTPGLLTPPYFTALPEHDRQLIVPLAVRRGLTRRMQGFVNLPVGMAFSERSDLLTDEFSAVGGLGDVSAGVSYLIHPHRGDSPDIVGTVGFTAPTGSNLYESPTQFAAMGRGFWGISGDLSVIKSCDPMVLFASVGYEHTFGTRFPIGLLQPGESFNYRLGMGFAVNDYVTLSSIVLGTYQNRWSHNGVVLPNSDREPILLRLALTASLHNGCLIAEPSVGFGLTEDAPSATVGVTMTRRY